MKYGYLFKGYVFIHPTLPSFCLCRTRFFLNILVSSDSPSFSAASGSWRKKSFHFGYGTFYPKPLPTSESLIHLDLFLSACENGIPSSFPQGSSGALPVFARLACLFSRFAGPSWSQFKFEYFWILCHTPRAYWLLCQDHSAHFLELYEFSMHLVRQCPPQFFFKPNLLGPPWHLMFLY